VSGRVFRYKQQFLKLNLSFHTLWIRYRYHRTRFWRIILNILSAELSVLFPAPSETERLSLLIWIGFWTLLGSGISRSNSKSQLRDHALVHLRTRRCRYGRVYQIRYFFGLSPWFDLHLTEVNMTSKIHNLSFFFSPLLPLLFCFVFRLVCLFFCFVFRFVFRFVFYFDCPSCTVKLFRALIRFASGILDLSTAHLAFSPKPDLKLNLNVVVVIGGD